jgi:CDP-glycerol glycerophosphotransferase
VYRVEDYLDECLDSLLSESQFDVEVIAVDDASPDGCPAMLDRYAIDDPRLRVIHLERNGGLGNARNVGLHQATGDYVWFVDSDDRLAPGALTAVSESLERLDCDVLICDFAYLDSDGGLRRDPLHRLADGLPELFTLRERPAFLNLIMTAWNKIVRREFLLALGVSFGPGYYEDLPVTYPILLAARTICRLDLICYHYRRGRGGAITATESDRHFDLFDSYARVFDFLGDDHDLAPAVFDRIVRQSGTVFGAPGLVPRASRRRFFARMAANVARFRPPGHRPPPGVRGVQFRLVARDAYRRYLFVQRLNVMRVLLQTCLKRLRALLARGVRLGRAAPRAAYYRLHRLRPLDENLAVYAAYWYRGYACNPAAIYESARELVPSVHGVWVVTADQVATLPPGVDHVVPDSPRYLRVMARAKYLVNNVNFPHEPAKRRGSVHVQTQHGTPLKTLGTDLAAHPVAAEGMNFERLAEHVGRWDVLVSPNPHSTEVWRQCYPGGYRVLETGYPRNDRFFTASAEEVAAIRAALGIGGGRTAVLYAPTHREQHQGFVSLLDLAGLAASLGPSFVLLVRSHYFHDGPGALPDGVLDVSAYPRVEDLCLAADVLLTDYSSIMFDYACLDRPIVVYAPDWDEYRRIRGVYFDLLKEPPGPVARVEEEIAGAIEAGFGAASSSARAAFRDRFCDWEDGHAADRVVRAVFR